MTEFCCKEYAEASDNGEHRVWIINRFELSRQDGFRQWSTLPPARFCPWCGAEAKIVERKKGDK